MEDIMDDMRKIEDRNKRKSVKIKIFNKALKKTKGSSTRTDQAHVCDVTEHNDEPDIRKRLRVYVRQVNIESERSEVKEGEKRRKLLLLKSKRVIKANEGSKAKKVKGNVMKERICDRDCTKHSHIEKLQYGDVAQMVERSLCMREVQGSIPCISRFFTPGLLN
ncbi:unnamed protein product [Sphenostylis stenocarpa]|uniref:Uncharacterized protein n=1 Tax=Sphenostylis stenocarpa TaxID=92480 RepID=A0AA86S4Q7_9FABA|nr:unnamed protein product [Sphenostylis stenocarpa]